MQHWVIKVWLKVEVLLDQHYNLGVPGGVHFDTTFYRTFVILQWKW